VAGAEHQRLDRLSRSAREGFLALGTGVLSDVLTFASTIIVTRGLGPRGAGGVLEATGLFIILSIITGFGADTGTLREAARFRAVGRTRDIRTVIRISMTATILSGIVVGVLAFVFAPGLGALFFRGPHRAEGIRYIRLLAPFLPLAAATRVALAGTRALGSIVPFVAVQNVQLPLMRPALILGVILAGLGGTAVTVAWALPIPVGFAISAIALVAFLHRVERTAPAAERGRRPARAVAGEFWRFSLPRGFAGLFQIGVLYLDVLLLGGLRSVREAGIYAAASRLIAVGTVVLQGLGLVIAPQLSELMARDDRRGAQELFQATAWWQVMLAWPFYLSIAVFSPLVMRIFGPAFVEGQTALAILSIGILVLVGTGNNKIALVMAGKSTWNLGTVGLSFAVNLTLNLLLIPRYGMNGSAIAWTASFAVDNGLTAILLRRSFGLSPFGRGWLVVAVGSGVCFGGLGVAFRAVLGPTLPSALAFGVVATALYGVVVWRYRELLHVDRLRDAVRLSARRRGPTGPVDVAAPDWEG
jgi:O-antigen/teichoic acid export membrane protein